MLRETKALYEFGPFRLEPAERVLERGGATVPLAPKAFDLLLVLVERHGRLVEKDELLKLVWPDTFVEETNLTYNISVLRKALGDGTDGSKLIETVPKRGYRFAAPVSEKPPEAVGAHDRKRARRGWVAAACGAIAIAGLAAWAVVAGSHQTKAVVEGVPLTAYAGSQIDPALSPDGNQVAFSWNGENEGDFGIFLQQIGGSVPVRLTSGPGDDLSPAWSPDGRSIAFLRFSRDKTAIAIYLVPALGGAERKLAYVNFPHAEDGSFAYGAKLAWHPSGQWLAVADRLSPGARPGLCMVSAVTGEKRSLIPPPPREDTAPAFRPDGRYLAFIRVSNVGSSELYGVAISEGGALQGALTPLTSHPGRRTASPVWTPDGRDILFAAGPTTGEMSVWKIRSLRAGQEERVALAESGVTSLSIPRAYGNQKLRVAYARTVQDSNIWRIREPGPGSHGSFVKAEPFRSINTTRQEFNAQFSPDGNRIAFESSRSGTTEIWVCRSDGSKLVQLTAFGGAQIGGPQWAPDSERIVFHARPEGKSNLYIVSASGGPPRRLSDVPVQAATPSWSRDGRWIYYDTVGSHQVSKIPVSGGQPVQVSSDPGTHITSESLDGKWLYYSRQTPTGMALWKVPSQGGEGSQVLESLRGGRNFFVVEDGIYFIPRPEAGTHTSILFLNFSSGKTTTVAALEKPPVGLTAFPFSRGQARTILYGQMDRSGSDLMLIENLPVDR
jgi:Tol biopolymer transport system component/DNA-binding winged helix-turn-helix (wHTH) protein